MTSKDKVYAALQAGSNGVGISYSFTDAMVRPHIIFNLVSNVGKRLSNKRHSQKITWQVDYYSNLPLDIQGEELGLIQESLESAGGITNEWIEIPDVNVKSRDSVWRYMLEVVI